jgi:hypothetical protein
MLVAFSVGCTGPMMNADVVPPGVLTALGEDEGFLVMQIDTDVPVENVALQSGIVARALSKGQHLWIIRLPAGRYQWDRIDFGSQAGIDEAVFMSQLRVPRDDEFEFDVLPGAINYPGELIIRTDQYSRSSGYASIRNRNHSAMAVRRLRETHPGLIDAFPIRHAGSGEDGFLEFYSRQRQSSNSRTVSEPD